MSKKFLKQCKKEIDEIYNQSKLVDDNEMYDRFNEITNCHLEVMDKTINEWSDNLDFDDICELFAYEQVVLKNIDNDPDNIYPTKEYYRVFFAYMDYFDNEMIESYKIDRQDIDKVINDYCPQRVIDKGKEAIHDFLINVVSIPKFTNNFYN